MDVLIQKRKKKLKDCNIHEVLPVRREMAKLLTFTLSIKFSQRQKKISPFHPFKKEMNGKKKKKKKKEKKKEGKYRKAFLIPD